MCRGFPCGDGSGAGDLPGLADGCELAALDKEIEKSRVRFQPAMRDPFHERLQLRPLGAREQCDARAFDRGVADLQNFFRIDVGDESDALRRIEVEVAPETTGEVEDAEGGIVDAVFRERDLQAGDVGALRLRQCVDVGLAKRDRALAVFTGDDKIATGLLEPAE